MAKKTSSEVYPQYWLNQRTKGVLEVNKKEDLDKWKDYPLVKCNEDGSLK